MIEKFQVSQNIHRRGNVSSRCKTALSILVTGLWVKNIDSTPDLIRHKRL